MKHMVNAKKRVSKDIIGKKRVQLWVRGDVQGVSFRYFAKDIARKMGVTGWAENDPDGSVHMLVEGDKARVEEFVKWCNQGSPMATVEEVEVRDEDYVGNLTDFQVK